MKTCRLYCLNREAGYVPLGETRTSTKKTIYVQGLDESVLQCCPYMSVDKELDFICDETKVQSPPFPCPHFLHATRQKWARTRPQDPFAIASWLYRASIERVSYTTRQPMEVPLMMSRFIQARKGDHAPLTQCFADGMRRTLRYIQEDY